MPKPRTWVPIVLVFIFCLSAAALATNSQAWENNYYDFRHSSTLPGMLFGVTPQGQVGFGGAFQQNIPVAYTPAWGNFVAGGNVGSNDTKLHLQASGSAVNGTGFLGVGFFKAPNAAYLSWMDTGENGEEALNAQVEVAGPRSADDNRPAFAVGVQDFLNERNRYFGGHHDARSFYAVATGALPEATWRPVYWTLGWGTGRFQDGLAGVQIPVDDHFKVVGEYDSFNVNAGLAWGLNGAQNTTNFDVMAYAGMTALKHPVLGLTFTYH